MPMTHYMELLATNQPWNLILFMAIPVILAETMVVTELYGLAARSSGGRIWRLNRAAGVIGGVYFLGVFLYLLQTAVAPLTAGGLWRGWIDVGAVGFYLAGVVPLVGIALLDLRLIGRRLAAARRVRLHAVLVAAFLVVAHVAMILGMLDPQLSGGLHAH